MKNKKILIGLGLVFFVGIIVSLTSDSSNELSSDKENLNKEWIGEFKGVRGEYNMTNKYGEEIVISGNYITVPEIEYSFEFFSDNKSTILMDDGSTEISCYNVLYEVVENENNFTLTMKPESGSDCGGKDIILVKKDGQYNIAKGESGEPAFTVEKK